MSRTHRKSRGTNPSYVCFVGLQKAYDNVPRERFWHKLERLGVRGFMLTAIQALYVCANLPMLVICAPLVLFHFNRALG